MSENNQPYKIPQDNDDLVFCCKKLTTNQRKIGFYITLLTFPMGFIGYYMKKANGGD